ncbi:MAG: DNA-binding protein [Rikenellaceae bacterium]|nr:DNA-binding protein [Rikenellaceae bacterium]
MNTITFNELRRIKDSLPSGSMQRIADELGIEVDTVRNYFGGTHYKSGEGTPSGLHIEQGPDGGIVTLDDRTILDKALSLLGQQ